MTVTRAPGSADPRPAPKSSARSNRFLEFPRNPKTRNCQTNLICQVTPAEPARRLLVGARHPRSSGDIWTSRPDQDHSTLKRRSHHECPQAFPVQQSSRLSKPGPLRRHNGRERREESYRKPYTGTRWTDDFMSSFAPRVLDIHRGLTYAEPNYRLVSSRRTGIYIEGWVQTKAYVMGGSL